jgi:predicted nucleotidyltransferase component of viral defense system
MIAKWIEEYNPKSAEELLAALREIMQEIALAGLYRAGFFKEAAFYGGTCLRIFYDLPRFSEDLDFSLLKKNREFSISNYLPIVIAEFEALGMEVTVREKPKNSISQIESAFLKEGAGSRTYRLCFAYQQTFAENQIGSRHLAPTSISD